VTARLVFIIHVVLLDFIFLSDALESLFIIRFIIHPYIYLFIYIFIVYRFEEGILCLCLLDLSAAFDITDHILLTRLSSWFGIHGTACFKH